MFVILIRLPPVRSYASLNWVVIGLYNGLPFVQHQAIIQTNSDTITSPRNQFVWQKENMSNLHSTLRLKFSSWSCRHHVVAYVCSWIGLSFTPLGTYFDDKMIKYNQSNNAAPKVIVWILPPSCRGGDVVNNISSLRASCSGVCDMWAEIQHIPANMLKNRALLFVFCLDIDHICLFIYLSYGFVECPNLNSRH